MSVATVTPPPALANPPRAYWTADQFHDLCDSGWFGKRNVFLVDGELLEVPAPKPPHDIAVNEVCDYLRPIFAGTHYVRGQQGFNAGQDTDPVPDVAVVPGRNRDQTVHPTTAALIVEVAETSLSYDRRGKMHLYAAAGIPEYWVLDIVGRQLLVFRDPIADPTVERAHRYATERTLAETDRVSPQAAPAAGVLVKDLLP